MASSTLRILRAALAAAVLTCAPAAAQDHPKLSPFTDVRFPPGTYEVELDGTWFELVSIEGLGTPELLAYCQRNFGSRAEKRFAEDLTQVLDGMGIEPVTEVDLVLLSLPDRVRVERRGVPMTDENRQEVWRKRQARGPMREAAAVQRVEREHAGAADPRYATLAQAPSWAGWGAAGVLTRAEAEADLDQLEGLVQRRYSYRDLEGVDVAAAFDALRLSLGEPTPRELFAVQLARLLALFGDGHSRLELPLSACSPPGYASFLVGDAQGGAVALHPGCDGFLAAEHPSLVEIDGLALEHWVAAAASLRGTGSPQFRRYQGLRGLRELQLVRLLLGRELRDSVALTLADAGGERIQLELELELERPVYGEWPRSAHRVLLGNLGYLRIPAMESEPEFLAELRAAMESFEGTAGLVIDVRGNGGGSRLALRELLPFFLPPGGSPRVVNVAAYRLEQGQDPAAPEGYLDNRFLYPAASPRWSPEERTVLAAAADNFRADWALPAGEFSDWHWFAISPGTGSPPFVYREPVVILQDAGCFSATDIFLGAFSGLQGVTLMGAPSGGGSGRSLRYQLAHSGLALRLSSMASFRPDGRRYDGLGIEPDRSVLPAPGDFLLGGGDAVLEAALEHLRAR